MSERISSIDYFRAIAIFAVVIIHTKPFFNSTNTILTNIGYAINQSARFAVPFFFISSGYFFGVKIAAQSNLLHIYLTYIKRIGTLLISWSIIYLIVPSDRLGDMFTDGIMPVIIRNIHSKLDWIIANPSTFMLQGTKEYLWFFISLMMAFSVITIFLYHRCRFGLIFFAAALYLIGLAAGSYSAVSNLHISFNTRNGPFFSTLFVAIGWWLSTKKLQPTIRISILLIAAGLVTHMLEAYYLLIRHGIFFAKHDYLLGTVLYGSGVFLFALSKPTLGKNKYLSEMGKYTLGIYASHIIIRDFFSPFSRYIAPIIWSILFPIITASGAYMLTKLMLRNRFTSRLVA